MAAEETGTIFASGLEHEVAAFTTDFAGKTDASSMLSLAASKAHSGSKSGLVTFDGTHTVAHAYKTGLNNLADVYVRGYFYITGMGGAADFPNIAIMALYSGATEQLRVVLQGGDTARGRHMTQYRLTLLHPATAVYSTGYGSCAPDCWHRIEIRYVQSATVGGAQIWVDGESLGSNFAKDTSAYPITALRVGSDISTVAPANTCRLWFDDVRVEATAIGAYNEVVQPRTQKFGLSGSLATQDNDTGQRDKRIALAQYVHANVVRFGVDWSYCEPTTKGTYVWTRLDGATNELAVAGIDPMIHVFASPQWANGGADPNVVPGTDIDATYLAWEANYCGFLTALVHRYKATVKMWEVWNEPNGLSNYWKPAANQTQYNHCYVAARAAILAEDPTAKVAFCFDGPNVSGGVAGKTWLQAAYDAGVFPDYISMHSYRGANDDMTPLKYTDNANNIGELHRIRAVQAANNALVPIWFTEWGYTTVNVSQAAQAAYVATSLKMIRDYYPYVTVATYWDDVDAGGSRDGYGLSAVPGAVGDYKVSATSFKTFMEAFPAGAQVLSSGRFPVLSRVCRGL